MAIYHFCAQVIQRSAGRSSVGAAAYRAGERIRDERTGITHSYERKRDVEHTEIVLPDSAPAWASDRAKLWNGIEQFEKRKDSQTAREFELALPRELSQDQQKTLVREWVKSEFTSRGIVADFAIHSGHKTGEDANPHAHVLVATRAFTAEGKFGSKIREDNTTEKLIAWRESWERSANHALERSGHDERIDRRTLAEQGIDREPTVHLGQRVLALEKQGVATERGEINRQISVFERAREMAHELRDTLSIAWTALEERVKKEVHDRLSPPMDQHIKARVRFTEHDPEPQTGTAKNLTRDRENGISILVLKNNDKTSWKPYEYHAIRIDEPSADALPSLSMSHMSKREIAFSGERTGGLAQVERDPKSLERERERGRTRSLADEIPMSRHDDRR